MMAADYRHIGGRENRLGRHYSRFSAFWPAPALAGQSLALRKLCDAGSNRRSRASDDVLQLDGLPRTLAVVGAGVIGCEYASIFAALGVRVTLIDKRSRLLPFVDGEIVEALTYHLRENRMTLRLSEEVSAIEPVQDERGERLRLHLASGKQIVAE